MKMKNKLNFIVAIFALLIFSSLALAQSSAVVKTDRQALENSKANTPDSRMNVKLQTLGKFHMVVSVFETQDLYSETKSKDKFVSTLIRAYGKSSAAEPLRQYLGAIYDYHEKGLNPDLVWQQEKGDAFAKLTNQMSGLIRKNSTKRDIQKQIFPDVNFDNPQMRPGWLNLIRKIIDLLDDWLHSSKL